MRPIKLSEEVISDIETALTLGSSIRIAAAYAGVGERTFYLWQQQGKELYDALVDEDEALEQYKEAVKDAKAAKQPPPDKPERRKLNKSDKLLLQLLHTISQAKAAGAIAHLNFLYKQAPHNPSVSQWLLDRRYPEDFAQRPTQIQHTGRDGGPILTEDLSNLTMPERATRTHQLLMLAAERKEELEKKAEDAQTDSE